MRRVWNDVTLLMCWIRGVWFKGFIMWVLRYGDNVEFGLESTQTSRMIENTVFHFSDMYIPIMLHVG